jgi:hypothetical protein
MSSVVSVATVPRRSGYLVAPPRIIGTGGAQVHLLLDPPDSLRVQRAIESLAAPDLGTLVLTPTPGTQSGAVLLQDLLEPLGFPRQPSWDRLSQGMVEVTIDILRRRQVRNLYVLRAHGLHDRVWDLLLILAERAYLTLWLTLHGEGPSLAQLRRLEGCDLEWHLPPLRQGQRREPREWRPHRTPATMS